MDRTCTGADSYRFTGQAARKNRIGVEFIAPARRCDSAIKRRCSRHAAKLRGIIESIAHRTTTQHNKVARFISASFMHVVENHKALSRA